MTLNVQYFNSSSSGAPALTGQNGAMVTLLNWLLVTQGGWTSPFTSGTTGAYYKPKAGNQFLLKVVHNSATSGSAALATVRAVESATAFGTDTNPVPLVAQIADTSSNWIASSTADATVRTWDALVADTFVVLEVQISTAVSEFHFFGDCPKMFSTDVYNTAIVVRNSTSLTGSVIGSSIGGTSTARMYFMRSIDGTVLSCVAYCTLPNSGAAMGFNTQSDVYPPNFDSKWHKLKIVLADVGSTTITQNVAKATAWRAWLPNVWHSMHSGYTGVTNRDIHSDTAYNASAVFQAFGAGFTATTLSTAVWVIEQTDTWVQPSV